MSAATAQASALQNFTVETILSENGRQKTVAILGSFNDQSGQAVILLAKKHFELKSLEKLFNGLSVQNLQFQNDIYSKYTAAVPTEEGCIEVDVIYPATEKHISKYSDQHYYLVQESPAQYEKVTKPYIEGIPAARLQWVYNILDGKAEADRVIYSETDPNIGFTLLVDQKWDQQQVEGMYLQAIVHRRDLRSLRDLTAAHLLLLEHIRSKCKAVVAEKYAVQAEMTRLWMHYQPSYYHLHVHVAHSKWDGAGLNAGKAVLLADVIVVECGFMEGQPKTAVCSLHPMPDNLAAIESEYYKKRTLTFSLGENDPLLPGFLPGSQQVG